MNDSEKLRKIKEVDYDRYVDISSLEKLAAYAIKYLDDNGISTTWTNLVIATYYLFPRKFAISEEFIDFPNAERLNRTLMHLVPPKGRNYAIGNTKIDYTLTPLGLSIAKEVEETINAEAKVTNRKQEVISSIKVTPMTCYEDIKNSEEYKSFSSGNGFSVDMIWTLYKVIPFTQKDRITKKLIQAKKYAQENSDKKCAKFIDLMINAL